MLTAEINETSSSFAGTVRHSLDRPDPTKKTTIAIRQVRSQSDWVDFMSVYIQCYPDRDVSPQSVNWIGYINGIPVSCVSVKHNQIRGIVFDLGTAPGFRGMGFGRDMTRHALIYLRDIGCKYGHAAITPISGKIAHSIISEADGVNVHGQ